MIRLFDCLFSALGILLLSPLILILMLLNLPVTGGKPFFVQKRVGKDGKEFNLVKFRTMYPDKKNNSLITIGEKDSRITGIGYYYRKHKLDEIPQLFNVLIGKMSMIGPRPEVRKYVDLYTDEQRKTLLVRPGITDYASLEYYNESELLAHSPDPETTYIKEIMPHKIELNQKFISDFSVRQYFLILALTIKRIFLGSEKHITG